MGIYVKYMEMPEGCVTCYLKHDCCDFKQQISSGNIIKYIDKRLDACPLIEVTEPHGRLIDANDVNERIRKRLGIRNLDYLLEAEKPIAMSIKESPTVIEAEGE